jgi:hypothetical protein
VRPEDAFEGVVFSGQGAWPGGVRVALPRVKIY